MNQRSRITGHTAPTTTTIPPLPGNTPAERQLLAELTIGYRIMRETEIAPSWWARPVEIGETVSATVAMKFCDEQNAATMNPNRDKRQRYFADPIYAAPATPARRLFAASVKRGTGPLVIQAVAA
ncbi:hypothetical protein [Streptomyces sp. NBC_01422]|uniref:hypothetical protein n=1 Tax=Streptomyces sp. NBC_01422 TaxID=2903859 RepID=UPI002E28038B|nr:hypothetical protein [Streptomyces sp. NBC_01422]